jgi:hypothetical protein
MTATQFLNLSNHTIAQWSRTQMESLPGGCVSACDFEGSLIVDPFWGTDELCRFAHTIAAAIFQGGWQHVHVAGEPGLVVSVVSILQTRGIACWHATTARRVVEVVSMDGSVRKESRFQFVRWRQYTDVGVLIREYTEIPH